MPMNTLLLSFIIPVYNAEPYLKECLDSIYRLDMQGRGFEVIVVNDGSSDGTAAFLENYQKRHGDIIVITQENRGLSAARNAGMRVAKGEYLCFVDADDHLFAAKAPVRMLEEYRADIFSVNLLQTDFNGKRIPYRRYIPPYEQLISAQYFMQGRNLLPCAWGYFWRTAFLREQNLAFVDGMLHEDEAFTPHAFALAQTFMALNIDWYERILHHDSITTTTDQTRQQKGLRDMVAALQYLEVLVQKKPQLRACMQYKLDYLAVDTLRILLRQRHTQAFQTEITSALRAMGYFPLRWHSEWKYILFNLYTRMRL